MPYRLYILVRNDLPSLNTGKAIAQAVHAGNKFTAHHGHKRFVKEWMHESCEGFGTTIALSVSKEELNSTVSRTMHKREIAGIVVDTTYPYIVNSEIAGLIDKKVHTADPVPKENGLVLCFRSEVTCGFAFLNNEIPEHFELVGGLPLHP